LANIVVEDLKLLVHKACGKCRRKFSDKSKVSISDQY